MAAGFGRWTAPSTTLERFWGHFWGKIQGKSGCMAYVPSGYSYGFFIVFASAMTTSGIVRCGAVFGLETPGCLI